MKIAILLYFLFFRLKKSGKGIKITHLYHMKKLHDLTIIF